MKLKYYDCPCLCSDLLTGVVALALALVVAAAAAAAAATMVATVALSFPDRCVLAFGYAGMLLNILRLPAEKIRASEVASGRPVHQIRCFHVSTRLYKL
jgi:hypothetical protein